MGLTPEGAEGRGGFVLWKFKKHGNALNRRTEGGELLITDSDELRVESEGCAFLPTFSLF